jgi:hypothetical protein
MLTTAARTHVKVERWILRGGKRDVYARTRQRASDLCCCLGERAVAGEGEYHDSKQVRIVASRRSPMRRGAMRKSRLLDHVQPHRVRKESPGGNFGYMLILHAQRSSGRSFLFCRT